RGWLATAVAVSSAAVPGTTIRGICGRPIAAATPAATATTISGSVSRGRSASSSPPSGISATPLRAPHYPFELYPFAPREISAFQPNMNAGGLGAPPETTTGGSVIGGH